MLISVRWLNRLLSPSNLTADEAEAALTRAGFPIESREELSTPSGPDTRLDVEITSNRGDCMSHLGVAREIAAVTGRGLVMPEVATLPGGAGGSGGAGGARRGGSLTASSASLTLENHAPDDCARFTARVIRGVKVGPSPAWLREALESVGLRSINNIVDVTNFVLFELGNPSHVFDLAKLGGAKLVIRFAHKDEPLTTLDGRSHKLLANELVVADAQRATSLAGVIGGDDSSVTESTRDIVLEVATWKPATIRRPARRLNIRTDASARFERVVDPRTAEFASARATKLILDLAGGTPEDALLDAGPALSPPTVVSMRSARCDALLGVHIDPTEQARILTSLDIDAKVDADRIVAEIPAHRHDLSREVDLIEEIGRIHGLDRIPILETIPAKSRPASARQRAMREVRNTLVGAGFFETVTFSFVSREDASAFVPTGLRTLAVDEARRKGEPALRPSVIPSLLRCRKVNQDAGSESALGVAGERGVRLFEIASVFAETDNNPTGPGQTVEHRNVAMLMDAPDPQSALRALRGVIEALVFELNGVSARVAVEPHAPPFPSLRDDACARLWIERANERQPLGYFALVNDATQKKHDLATPVVVAEIGLEPLIAGYPPAARVDALPAFPPIERDLSIVVAEDTQWTSVERIIDDARLAMLDARGFVGVYRGKQLGAGRKSVTFRLRFRDPARTLRHEEVDPQVAQLVEALKRNLGAELRA
ncbi:MAG: phenylalanine--tRNA ligase subunit beta [Phycisphaeraceae bacterium]|nr:phenylalanine--tRNA ligase subunit beta [Phycisphaeraceae bacterium]